MPRWPNTLAVDRFWSSVDRESTPDGCWPWVLAKSYDGYGRWKIAHMNVQPHRLAYVLEVGEIPEGMVIDHLCFNPACCRPSHLRVLSNQENAALQRESLKTHCRNGHLYDEANTYQRPTYGDGVRCCRTCQRESQRRQRATRRAS